MSDLDVRIASLIENIHRENLSEDEKLACLDDIYEESRDYWVPKYPTEYEQKVIENKGVKDLAKAYLKRIHNESSVKEFCVRSRSAYAKFELEKLKVKLLCIVNKVI